MIQRIKTTIMTLAISFGLMTPLAATAAVSAQAVQPDNNINTGLCTGVSDAAGGNNGNCFNQTGATNDSLANIAKKIINIFSIIVGIIAVIMIIYGGFRYITSGGSSDKVGGAKNTLIYAIIGLIIVALAQFIVHFVLNTTSSSISGT